jgi:hypothetical protein
MTSSWSTTVRAREALLLILAAGACAEPARYFGLKPEYPPAIARSGGKEALFSRVESTRPMLAWEAFPPRDASGFNIPDETMRKVKWVVYDLKVYAEDNGSPGRLVEDQRGLAEPHFQFQSPLTPCAKYFWSVRARFQLEGREEATEWGVIATAGRDRWVPVVPDPGFYRFEIPCDQTKP